MKKLALIMLPLLFGGFAHAQDQTKKINLEDISMFGANASCPQIVAGIKSNNPDEANGMKGIVEFYIYGFLTAYNLEMYGSSGKTKASHVGDELNPNYIVAYMTDYCMHNPKHNLIDSTMSLMKDLIK